MLHRRIHPHRRSLRPLRLRCLVGQYLSSSSGQSTVFLRDGRARSTPEAVSDQRERRRRLGRLERGRLRVAHDLDPEVIVMKGYHDRWGESVLSHDRG